VRRVLRDERDAVGFGQGSLDRAHQSTRTVKDQDGWLARVAGDQLARGCGGHAGVGPTEVGRWSLGNTGPIVGPLKEVAATAYAHWYTPNLTRRAPPYESASQLELTVAPA